MKLSQFQAAKCDGIDLFFKTKPQMSMSVLLSLVKTLNVGVILDADTTTEMTTHPLVKTLTTEHTWHEHTSPGYNGRCYRVTCFWPEAHEVDGPAVLERLRAVFEDTALDYIGAELYLPEFEWQKRQVTKHGVQGHYRTIGGKKRFVRSYKRGG